MLGRWGTDVDLLQITCIVILNSCLCNNIHVVSKHELVLLRTWKWFRVAQINEEKIDGSEGKECSFFPYPVPNLKMG